MRDRVLGWMGTSFLLVMALMVPLAAPQSAPAGLPAGSDGWEWQNPLPQGEDLNSVHFVDASTGWAVGARGTILKIGNGGATWTAQSSGTLVTLYSVHFVGVNTGWAVGTGGTILKTPDGGATWSASPSGTNETLTSVHFVDAFTGWAVGNRGTILKTANGGATWSTQSSGTSESLHSVYFVDAFTGWVVGSNGRIFKTTNGGATWTRQTSGVTPHLWSIHFVDADTGWVVGDGGTILKTTNGGATWSTQSSGTTNLLYSVHFVDAFTGWAVGSSGRILKTANGGATWTTQSSDITTDSRSIHFVDADNGWVVGLRGRILKTTNGGATWSAQPSGTIARHLYSVHFVDANTGWAAGDGGTILKTTNGGAAWSAQPSGTDLPLRSVHFADANSGLAVGSAGTILKTTNGGASWLAQSSGTWADLYSVRFIDANTGWAVGSHSTILKTTDGGSTWTTQMTLGTGGIHYSVHFIDANTGWVAAGSTILKTTDGGETWAAQSGAGGVSVQFIDANTGWAVGGYGTIRKTTNGGATWTTQTSGTLTLGTLNSVNFVDANTGWAVGDVGSTTYGTPSTILKTTDGGATWTVQSSGTGNYLYSVHFADSGRGWAVGQGGTILRYGVGPSTVVPDESDKPLVVFVGGIDSKVKNDDSDPLFGFMRAFFRERGYHTLAIPSYPKSQQEDVIDSAMAFGPRSDFTDNSSPAERISARLIREGYGGRDIILVAHSMGGLISRDYAARWTKLPARCEPLAIVQLGTPNDGSPTAILGTVFKAPKGHDAIRALTPGGSYLENFNTTRKNSGAAQVPIYQFAGAYFPYAARESISPGEHLKEIACDLVESHFLLSANDGLVSVDSVFAQPEKGVKFTQAVLARHTYSNPFSAWSRAAAPHIVPQGRSEEESRVLLKIQKIIQYTAAKRVEPNREPVLSGQAQAMFAQTLVEAGESSAWKDAFSQVLVPSDVAVSEFFSLEGSGALVWATGSDGSTADVLLESESGTILAPALMSEGAEDGMRVFDQVGPGRYRVLIEPSDPPAGIEIAISVVDAGPTVLKVSCPSSVRSGQGIEVRASVVEGDAVTLGATMSARFNSGASVNMRDDGVAPDETPGDGVFSALLPSSETSGAAEIEVVASGVNSHRVAFERRGMAFVDVVEPRAALANTYYVGELRGESGKVTTVTVDVGVRAAQNCDVMVAADIAAADGGDLLAQVEGGAIVGAGEVATVTVEVPASALAGRLGASDGFICASVRLIDMTEGSMSTLEEASPMVSGVLLVSDMEHSGLSLSVVGSSPSSSTITVLEGDAVCTTETVAGVEISFDYGVEWFLAPYSAAQTGSAESTWSCAVSLNEGDYVATARAFGAAGTIPGTTESIVFTVDRSAPVAEASISDYYPAASATVTVEATDMVSFVEGISYQLDGAEPVTIVAETLELPVSTGVHSLEYWATDAAGNESERVTADFVVGERHAIVPLAGAGGSITPAPEQLVDWGSSKSFLITPDPGFVISDVLVDGESVGAVAEYTFWGVTSDHSIVATFIPSALIVEPIAGSSRYATAIEASKKAFPDGASCVVIATGSNWPDALGGGALAAAKGGPILLTQTNVLPADVLAEIRRLDATEAVVLGGEAAVGKPVFDALKAELGIDNVTRIGGAGRYQTAELIAEATVAELGAAYDGTCFIATGSNFPDALGASPLAAAKGWPLLLSGPSGLSASTLSTLDGIGATKALVLGGTAVVPNSVMTQLAGRSPERLEGAGRYGTARVVAQYGVDHAGLGWDKVALATGENFPDALAGGVLQGRDGTVMLLTPGAYLHTEPQAALQANKADIHTVRFLGGESAVKPAARAQVQAALE